MRLARSEWYIIPLMDLFDHAHQQRMRSEAPLAARLRPRPLDKALQAAIVGQEEIVGSGRLLRRAQRCLLTPEADRLFSERSF